eukprot:Gb_14702 [translate_table: standard]
MKLPSDDTLVEALMPITNLGTAESFLMIIYLRLQMLEAVIVGEDIERNDAAPTGPLVKPNLELSAEDSVKLQLDALSLNDKPRVDHDQQAHYPNKLGGPLPITIVQGHFLATLYLWGLSLSIQQGSVMGTF